MRLNKLQFFLVILISVLIGYGVGLTKVTVDWKNYKPQLSVINKEPPSSLSTVDLASFWSVWDKINTLYYDKKVLDPQKMLNGAITGLVNSIGDPFTMYLPPVQNNNFQQQLAGQFSGIGAELGTKDKQIIVIAPLDGSPAQKAGIKAGDTILKVNDLSIDGLTIQQVVDKIRGPKGTQVQLAILHTGEKEVKTIDITRDTITVKSVVGWVKQIKDIDAIKLCHDGTTVIPAKAGIQEDGSSIKSRMTENCNDKIMYVRLSQFGDATNQDWGAIIDQLQKQDKDVKGMVFDLRNNPGGYLQDAVFIAGEFLKEGTPVVTEDMGNNDTTTLSVTRKGQLLNMPVIVLINGGSASAAEIVSGALRDYNRAKLLGEVSYGKGTVQQALDLGQGAGLHVTIAKWLTPKGTWVSDPKAKGLTPDIKVTYDIKDPSHDNQLEAAIEELLK